MMNKKFSFFNDTIIRIRPGVKNERGSDIPDWDNSDYLTVENCSVQPGNTNISIDGRVLGLNCELTVYAPYTADIKSGDHIKFDEDEYIIKGYPKKWKSPTDELDHIQLDLERFEG